MHERDRIALLRQIFEDGERAAPVNAHGAAQLTVGIGDDAAVVRGCDPLVISVDSVVQGVHFQPHWLTHQELGYKATMAALSDLAAMGATPCGVLSSLVLPQEVDDGALQQIARGQAEACRSLGTRVIGGNLARGGELSITTTVMGKAERPLQRSGAQAGDQLMVAGSLGLASAGLHLLQSGQHARRDGLALNDLEGAALAAWRRPRALIAAGLAASHFSHAAIDLSDGLALDSWRMAEESGLRLVLERDAVIEDVRGVADRLGLDPEKLALHGGEDYALLIACPKEHAPAEFRRIGSCEAGPAEVLLATSSGSRKVPASGWDHFQD